MNSQDWLLMALSAAGEAEFTPVQIQKMLFLIEKGIGNTGYDFKPYDYGPFDAAVYENLRQLVQQGLVRAIPTGRGWSKHALNAIGAKKGAELAAQLSEKEHRYIVEVSSFVRSLSFNDLVRAIYKAFPEMKANSVFRD